MFIWSNKIYEYYFLFEKTLCSLLIMAFGICMFFLYIICPIYSLYIYLKKSSKYNNDMYYIGIFFGIFNINIILGILLYYFFKIINKNNEEPLNYTNV